MLNLLFSATILREFLIGLSFKPLEERINMILDLIGYSNLYSFEFMDICINTGVNDDLIEHIYLKSYKDEEILKKNISYINTERYILREVTNSTNYRLDDVKNDINDNLWDLYDTAVKCDKPFLVELIIYDKRFNIDDWSYHMQLFDYLKELKNPSGVINVMFLNERISKYAKSLYIEELFKENKFPLLKYIIDDKQLFNKENVTINKKNITKYAMRAVFYDNDVALSYLIENKQLFKFINIDKLAFYTVINNDSFKCFKYLVENNYIDLPNKYEEISTSCVKAKSYDLLTTLISFDCISGKNIFNHLKPIINRENINDIIEVYVNSGKVDIYQDDYHLFERLAGSINKESLKLILQKTVLKFESDDVRKVIRKTIFRSDPIDMELIRDYITNTGFDDENYVASEAIIAFSENYFNILLKKYPKYKLPDDIYYMQILTDSSGVLIEYCLNKSLFKIKKWSHYLISKLLDKKSPDTALMVINHKKTVIRDETITAIYKFFDANSRIYPEEFFKKFKMAIRMKKLADIIS
jgi:hypothetical protein